jgi:hypothetical protein
LGAIFVTTLMTLPQLSRPDVAEAASCTGWTSLATPPVSIKVLRSGAGKVQKVAFRRYVAEVMASGEWPSRLRKATLEAGAVATKQYAWYYAMNGNHRSSYVHNGRCYDVRDDTRDQLYRPEKTRPTAKQEAAVARTWGLTLRKNGRFFLTGYRAGSVAVCGADANGWKLYAKSVEQCAANGWSYKRILNRYYGPDVKLTWSDTLGPLLKKPKIRLKTGTHYANGVTTVSWAPFVSNTNVKLFRLQRKIGKGDWSDVSLDSLTSRRTRAWVKPGANNRFRIRARDAKDRKGPWAYSQRRKAAIRGPAGISLSGAGVGPTSSATKVKTTFEGRSVALMARTGPGMGKARVSLNGRRVAVVDLEADVVTDRALVWARNFPASKTRTVAVKPVDPNASVYFDGFFILR